MPGCLGRWRKVAKCVVNSASRRGDQHTNKGLSTSSRFDCLSRSAPPGGLKDVIVSIGCFRAEDEGAVNDCANPRVLFPCRMMAARFVACKFSRHERPVDLHRIPTFTL